MLGQDEIRLGSTSKQTVVENQQFVCEREGLGVLFKSSSSTERPCDLPESSGALFDVLTLGSSTEERISLKIPLVVTFPRLEQIPVQLEGLVVGDMHQGAQFPKRFSTKVGVKLQTVWVGSL